ncbi:hypothetical protein DL95DRAFT_384293, partial [Leptodontidium sp. 2 PMI_412]
MQTCLPPSNRFPRRIILPDSVLFKPLVLSLLLLLLLLLLMMILSLIPRIILPSRSRSAHLVFVTPSINPTSIRTRIHTSHTPIPTSTLTCIATKASNFNPTTTTTTIPRASSHRIEALRNMPRTLRHALISIPHPRPRPQIPLFRSRICTIHSRWSILTPIPISRTPISIHYTHTQSQPSPFAQF